MPPPAPIASFHSPRFRAQAKGHRGTPPGRDSRELGRDVGAGAEPRCTMADEKSGGDRIRCQYPLFKAAAVAPLPR